MKKRIAVYPGTFDPITLGHLDIIQIGSEIFDKLIVGILDNTQKRPMIDKVERKMLVQKSLKERGISNVEVENFGGLTVEFARQKEANVVIRGLRLTTEYEGELNISFNNRNLDGTIYTILIPPLQEHIHISSSAVREQIAFKKFERLDQYVSPCVADYIKERYS